MLVSKELISLLHLSLLHLEEDKTALSQESRRIETLVSCCCDVLRKLKARLQSLKAEKEEAMHKEEMALRGKDAVRCHVFVPGCERSLPQGSCRNTKSPETQMTACLGE